MRWVMLFLLGICFISIVSADESSSAETNFSIGGCNFVFDDESYNAAVSMCFRKEAAASGEFYCDLDSFGWFTRSPGLGCSMGDPLYVNGAGLSFCCPSGYFCNSTGVSSEFKCDRRLEMCGGYNDSVECVANDCFWFYNECIEFGDLGCGDYNNSVDCTADVYNFSSGGIGTETCGSVLTCNGTTYSIPEDSCGCDWNAVSDECQVKIVAVQMFYNASDTNVDSFSCSNTFSLDACVDGRQNVTWSSMNQTISGLGSGIPDDCLFDIGCVGGATTRSCGEPIIKLPGFGLFSIFVSLGLICLSYLFRKDLNNKRY